MLDLAADCSAERLAEIAERLISRKRLRVADLERCYLQFAGSGRRGLGRVEHVLSALNEFGLVPTRSDLDVILRRLVREVLADEDVEFEAAHPGNPGSGECADVRCRRIGLLVEADGRTFHARVEAFESDHRRDRKALGVGVETVRYTYRELMREYAECRADLTTIVARRRRAFGLAA